MATGTFEYGTEAERKSIERAIAFAAEMHALALAAPAEQVLDRCEGQVLSGGRDLLRRTRQEAAQGRVDGIEVKKGRRGDVRARARSTGSGGASGASRPPSGRSTSSVGTAAVSSAASRGSRPMV